MKYQIRPGKTIQVPAYKYVILSAIDWIDDKLYKNQGRDFFIDWISGIWLNWTKHANSN